MNERVVAREILDHLPADDPEAIRSRKDLERINILMGNIRWICRNIPKFSSALQQGIAEIGAGDGKLCNRLHELFPDSLISGYDLVSRPPTLHSGIHWHSGDIFQANPPNLGGVLVANLFLHHFEKDGLAELGRWVSGFDVLIVNEPDRATVPHLLGRTIHPWINGVTIHDMHASIRAGFSAGEMARLLGLDRTVWKIRENSTWRGSRRMVAWRN